MTINRLIPVKTLRAHKRAAVRPLNACVIKLLGGPCTQALLASRSLYRGPNAFRGPEGGVCVGGWVVVVVGEVNDTDPHFPNSYSIQQ